jgi:chemotaxis protein MotB
MMPRLPTPANVSGIPLFRLAAAAPAPRTPWLITIVDLVTLLLAFFVMLFSMSDIEAKRYHALAKSYGDAFGVTAAEPSSLARLPKIPTVSGEDLAYLEAVLKRAFAATVTLNDVQFHRTDQYLILSLPVEGVFAPGSGAFTDTAAAPVFDLGGVLSNLKNRIAVVGSAVMTPDDGPGAWNLAMARAEALATALEGAGYQQPITVLGRGGARGDVGAALGRVDILIMPEQPGS